MPWPIIPGSPYGGSPGEKIMGVHSGKFGVVNGAYHVRNWSLEGSETPEVYYASNTRGGAFRNSGVEDWIGSFEGFEGQPPWLPGSNFNFKGYTAPHNDVFGANGQVYDGNFIVDQVAINWNWGPAQSLGWTLNMSLYDFVAPTNSLGYYNDTSLDVPQKMCGLKFQHGDAGNESDIENLISGTLTITSDNQVYVNSSTNCLSGRKPGNLDWTLTFAQQNEDEEFTRGTYYRLKLFTTNSLFWELEWGIFTGYTNFVVDRETGAIIQKTANFAMAGSDGSTLGEIIAPDLTQVWPPTSASG